MPECVILKLLSHLTLSSVEFSSPPRRIPRYVRGPPPPRSSRRTSRRALCVHSDGTMGLSGVHRGRMSRRVVPLVLVSFLMRISWQTPFVVGASTPLVIAPSEFTAGAFVAVRVHGAVGASGLTVVLADLNSTTSPVTVATASVPSSGGDAVTVTMAVPSSVDTT